MADTVRNCKGCGQFAGRGHTCPTAVAPTQPYAVERPPAASGYQPIDTGDRVSRAQAFLQRGNGYATAQQTAASDGATPFSAGYRSREYSPNPDAPNVWREGNALVERVTINGRPFDTIYPNRTPSEFGRWATSNDPDWTSEEFHAQQERTGRQAHEERYARAVADYQRAIQKYEIDMAEYQREADVMCGECHESVKSQRHILGCVLPKADPNATFVVIGAPRKPQPPVYEPFVYRKPSIDRDPMVRQVRS